MRISTVVKKMLYCPKCQKTYADGRQRFCLNEGERLVPFAAGKAAANTGGVFTNVLKRKNSEVLGDFPAAQFSAPDKKTPARPEFRVPTYNAIFKPAPEFELELELDPPKAEFKPIFARKNAPPVEPEKFESGSSFVETVSGAAPNFEEPIDETMIEAEPVDETIGEPVAESSNAPEILLDQIVKDRYRLVEKIGADENGATFMAEDEKTSRKVVVSILKGFDDAAAERTYTNERAALLKLKHPNLAAIVDASELPNGAAFLVFEKVEGETVGDLLAKNGRFDALRAARIVRQAADALDEAHRAGILHRNLTAESFVLAADENGAERVKIVNFGGAEEKLNEKNLPYKSPEQVEGKNANPASDNYSLGVIAYQMLTNRLPFSGESIGDLLKAQREGLKLRPSDVRFDLPPAMDAIAKKSMAFHSFERYLKARDFGDAFFSEIIANLPFEDEDADDDPVEELAATPFVAEAKVQESKVENKVEPENESQTENVASVETPIAPPRVKFSKKTSTIVIPPVVVAPAAPVTDTAPIILDAPVFTPAARDKIVAEAVKAKDAAWEQRSSEPPPPADSNRHLFSVLGIGALVFALVGIWYFFVYRLPEPALTTVETTIAPTAPTESLPIGETSISSAPTPEDIEAPPIPRQVEQPANSFFFQNSKNALKGDAAKNYLGFSLYYPTDWAMNDVGKNFLDISKKAPNGLPVEQMLVSYYNSKGTYKADAADIFAAQVQNTNETLKKILPNYRLVGEGKKTVNNGWQAYEVKFEGASKAANGGELKIWGKRLFIPTAIRGMKNGYVLTMLATSLSKDVQSIEDVGVKGELSTILETFEPNQNF